MPEPLTRPPQPSLTRRSRRWERQFRLLEAYVAREGHAQVPQDWRENGEGLGVWVAVQRRRYRQKKLAADRQLRLAALPGWTWRIRARTSRRPWDQAFSLLEAFVAREGHARVPSSHMEDGYRLGAWVSDQRWAKQLGRLGDERQRRLERLPGWAWRYRARPLSWDQAFSLLEAFVAREGHARVPSSHMEDGYRLGAWVSDQRWAKQLGRLGDERQQCLERLPGWVWPHLPWERRFSLLVQFVNREGHALVPLSHVEEGIALGGWVGRQRAARQSGVLSVERQQRLERLPGWVWRSEPGRRPSPG